MLSPSDKGSPNSSEQDCCIDQGFWSRYNTSASCSAETTPSMESPSCSKAEGETGMSVEPAYSHFFTYASLEGGFNKEEIESIRSQLWLESQLDNHSEEDVMLARHTGRKRPQASCHGLSKRARVSTLDSNTADSSDDEAALSALPTPEAMQSLVRSRSSERTRHLEDFGVAWQKAIGHGTRRKLEASCHRSTIIQIASLELTTPDMVFPAPI